MFKMRNRNKIFIAVGIIILVALLIFVFRNSFTGKSVNSGEESSVENFSFYDEDLCRCLERARPVCFVEGFIYNVTRKICVNYAEKTVTTPIMKCSKYECAGEIYEYNLEIGNWEVEN